ncbi:MAG: DNA topoisomerase IB [Propionibacteriales bacterium]|nr:DNA topoisomerase IB [Propionibacteriales bacterium]
MRALVIPPAWTEVWICPDERGHLQAVGTDDAGRRQYLYHPEWRRKRDAAKFDRAIELGRRLPHVRARLRADLEGEPTARETVLAAAVRIIDLACFRLGSDQYADEYGSYGLSTLELRHVGRSGDERTFAFVGKAGIDHEVGVSDPAVIRVVDALRRRRDPGARLLAAREGRRWRVIEAGEVNERIRELVGLEVTAKDFRTWRATVSVAADLAALERASSRTARDRQVRQAIVRASELLGNTPAVARSSYVDPRVIDLFDAGRCMTTARSEDGMDRAVVKLLSG